jgi:hypothetical protein
MYKYFIPLLFGLFCSCSISGNKTESASNKDITINVAVYETYTHDEAIAIVGKLPVVDDNSVLLYAHLKANESYTKRDTADINQLLSSDFLPRNIRFTWDQPFASMCCNLVAYNPTPVLVDNVSIEEIAPHEADDAIWQITFIFSDKGEWERISGENVNRYILLAVNDQFVSYARLTSPIHTGRSSFLMTRTQIEKLITGIEFPTE